MVTRRSVVVAAVKPVRSDDPAVEDLQRQVAELQRAKSPWSEGVAREVTWPSAGSTVIAHGLGRLPQGWIVQRLRSANNPVITERTDPTTTKLTLYSSADAIATILVY